MAMSRFFLPNLPASGVVRLDDQDARHAVQVLRLRVGEKVRLFDGQGQEADCNIVSTGRSWLELQIEMRESISRELPGCLQVIVSLPKGDRQKTLVETLVQIGVHSLTPLSCQRSVAQPTQQATQRLRRTVVEASKQCGRNHLMHIQSPAELTTIDQLPTIVPSETRIFRSDATKKSATVQPLASTHPTAATFQVEDSRLGKLNELKLFAHPYSATESLYQALRQSAHEEHLPPTKMMIGPEGGFTEEECQWLKEKGWQQVSLGQRILRIETAAIMMAATWAACQNSDA